MKFTAIPEVLLKALFHYAPEGLEQSLSDNVE